MLTKTPQSTGAAPLGWRDTTNGVGPAGMGCDRQTRGDPMATLARRWNGARGGLAVLLIVVAATGLVAGSAAQEATPPLPPATVQPYVPPEGIGGVGGSITIDDSSTVWPLSVAAAEEFLGLAGDIEFTVEFAGTSAGFDSFCNGQLDIAGASRPITPEEIQLCAEGNIRYYAFDVAYDGIAVVVHPENDFVDCLTAAQLQQLWTPDDPAQTWQDLDPAWPDREIDLFGPGPLSGTFDYFTDAIVGETGSSRTDYEPSEDDSALVEGVADAENGLGYFGLAYYQQSADRLKLVGVDAGGGCVLPAAVTVQDGTYQPLSRPLFLYVRLESLSRSTVLEFVRFYLATAGPLAAEVGYVPLSDAEYAAQQAKLEAAAVGNAPPDGP